MLLVADGGSAVTDWVLLLENKEILEFSSPGINPFFLSEREIVKVLNAIKILDEYISGITEVHFFGAGCNSPDRRETVTNALTLRFPNAFVNVENDILGSAYATCKDKPGINCILGTGSNISFYDGKILHEGVHGLGYIFDDEGSGTLFGKKLITEFLYKKMPSDLEALFFEEFKVTKEDVIQSIYQKPLPNFYLSSHNIFLKRHIDHPYCSDLLEKGLDDFVRTHILTYKHYKEYVCNFVGPTAFEFQSILKKVCKKHGVNVGIILEKPINELFNFVRNREGF
ncbi:N-acetylglucosamine kinase [Pseudopedobacter saltans DSM 12145]|uniref:N-acetylglucosamine kinase n=1 Tax=Pseudopedobacter saltans (strain ATCC 51119 / DSM 12145 / JCM 21818 / CCUG 39354 / LMG 10337 / NBRC 100064 / NCIMB 13643) TaxID=762903 RepID=F0S4S0_PSESL|nr:N-acetylglucosamine kinase [Pseudopedobacter saltans]ADY53088.1 N-acetylglucosamine kinase [Pseudopedobacter saltans DSM 12145]